MYIKEDIFPIFACVSPYLKYPLSGKKVVEEGFEAGFEEGFEVGFEVGFEEVFGRSLNFKPPELITFVKDLSTYNIYSGLKAPPVQ